MPELFRAFKESITSKDNLFMNFGTALTFAKYSFIVYALIQENRLATASLDQALQSLNELGLSNERHLECFKGYSSAIFFAISIALLELITIHFLKRVCNSLALEKTHLKFLLVLCLEVVFFKLTTLLRPLLFKELSNPESAYRLIVINISYITLVSMTFSIRTPSNNFYPLLRFITEIFLLDFGIHTFYGDIIPDNLADFNQWDQFSPSFVEFVTTLLKKYPSRITSCKVKFSTEKHLRLYKKNLIIPSEALWHYGESALQGYIAFVFAEQESANKLIADLTSMFCILSFTLAYYGGVKIACSKYNPFSESLGVCHILHNLEFFSIILLNFLYRKAEAESDTRVVKNGFKSHLIEYIKKLSHEAPLTGSPVQYGIVKTLSPSNCFKDRLEAIKEYS